MTRVRASFRASKPCKVCLLLPPSEAELVTGGLQAGWSARRLAERFTLVNRRDVERHKLCLESIFLEDMPAKKEE